MSSENASADAATPASDPAIDARVQSVESQVKALEAALAASRKARLTILVGLVVVIAVVIVLFKGLADELSSQEYITSLSNEAQEYVNENSDDYMKEVQKLADNAAPVVTKAFYEQAKKDAPKFTLALEREREKLMENVQQKLAVQISDKYEATLEGYEEILIQEFPKADDDRIRRRVVANFRESLNRMVQEFYADQFKEELQGMYDTWDGFPVADAAEEGDPALEDQLVGYLLELMTMKASGTGGLLETADTSSATATTVVPEEDAADETSTEPEPDTTSETESAPEPESSSDDEKASPPTEPESSESSN